MEHGAIDLTLSDEETVTIILTPWQLVGLLIRFVQTYGLEGAKRRYRIDGSIELFNQLTPYLALKVPDFPSPFAYNEFIQGQSFASQYITQFTDLPFELVGEICSAMDITELRKFISTNEQYRSLCQHFLEEKIKATQVVVTNKFIYFKTWDGRLLYIDFELDFENEEPFYLKDTPLLTNVEHIRSFTFSNIVARTKDKEWYIIEEPFRWPEPNVIPLTGISKSVIRLAPQGTYRIIPLKQEKLPYYIGLTTDGNIEGYDVTGQLVASYQSEVRLVEVFVTHFFTVVIDNIGKLYEPEIIIKRGELSYQLHPKEITTIFETLRGVTLSRSVARLLRPDFVELTIGNNEIYGLDQKGIWYQADSNNPDMLEWEEVETKTFHPLVIASGGRNITIMLDEQGGIHFNGVARENDDGIITEAAEVSL